MKNLLYILLFSLLISSCSEDATGEFGSGVEVLSGSYANMLTLGNFLYVLGDGQLKTLSLDDLSKPEILDQQTLDFDIESLFISGDNVFVGSMQAMYIYTIGENGIPQFQSRTNYDDFFGGGCFNDPIAANSEFAYTTLENATTGVAINCFRPELADQMRVYDISDLENPLRVNTIFMDAPKGVAMDGEILFVAQKDDGLRIFDISDGANPEELYHFSGFSAFDLIPANGLLMVVGDDALHQFDYSDIDNVFKIGQFALQD